jgi:hypothetical protein
LCVRRAFYLKVMSFVVMSFVKRLRMKSCVFHVAAVCPSTQKIWATMPPRADVYRLPGSLSLKDLVATNIWKGEQA